VKPAGGAGAPAAEPLAAGADVVGVVVVVGAPVGAGAAEQAVSAAATRPLMASARQFDTAAG
jgi:hypothetical protein